CLLAAQALNALAYLLQDRALAQRKFGGIYGLLPALVPMNKIGVNLMGAAVWMLGLSVVIGAVDAFTGVAGWVNLPKLVMAAVTLLLAGLLLMLQRRATLSGAAFARGSLWLLLPALLALWLSLPTAR
ncbi:MAG: Cytochrome assembly protein, partial [Verrucomicrobiota bacterium]